MKDGEVSPGGCVAPFVTPVLKAAIDFSTRGRKKKNSYIINLFVYSTSEPKRRCGDRAAIFQRGITSCFTKKTF